MAEESVKKTFFKGAVILGVAGVIIKVLGAVFRIPLANIIGDTGMGYYQTAYPVYNFLLTLSTAGIPVAISRMVSERNAIHEHNEAYRVFQVSLVLLSCIGLVSFSVLFFGADAIVAYLKPEENGESRFAMMAIAPALLVVPVMAAFRGFFQGMQNMKPTAVSQVTEQIFRVAVGLTLAVVLLKFGKEYAAAGATFGASAGSLVGLITVIIIYFQWRRKKQRELGGRQRQKPKESAKRILVQILMIAIPITIGSAVMPIINIIDVAMVARRLVAAGFSGETANALYGQLTGMAGPLLNFPQVLTQAVAMSLVPAVAAAHKVKDTPFLQHNVELGIRVALILGIPCSLGLMTLARPIMLLLYPAQKASAANAASCLFIMGIGVVFLSMVQTCTGILQGVGKQNIPVRNIMIGAGAKIVITYCLVAIPAININGAAIGTLCCYFLAASLNLLAVKKYTGARINLRNTVLKPLTSGVVMSLVTVGVYQLMNLFMQGSITTVIAMGAAMVTYGVMLLLTKAITAEEVELLPKGKKLAKIVRKFQR